MATEIVLPQWGMEMQDGTIVKWLEQEGDPVEEGEPIVEVEWLSGGPLVDGGVTAGRENQFSNTRSAP